MNDLHSDSSTNELRDLRSDLQRDSSVEALRDLLDRCKEDAVFLEQLLQCAREPELESASTWLMLNLLREARAYDAERSDELISLLPVVEGWHARLHILQTISKLRISSSVKADLHDWLMPLLEDKNNFVRTWAYDGLVRLAIQHPEHFQETEALLRRAMEFEKPSVTARIRNLLKEFDSKWKTGMQP